MVTRAGKKLLRNTIHTVDHHNKVLEEQDMWRQWELQQALTMMVSDDAIRSHAKYLRRRKDKSVEKQKWKSEDKTIDADLHKKDVESLKRMRNYWLNKLMEAEEKDPDRWGHSGFKELYPEEFDVTTSSKHSRTKCNERRKEKKKKKHKKRLLERSSTSPNSSASYTKNLFFCENNSSDRQGVMPEMSKSLHEETLESTDSTDYEDSRKKPKRKHHSLNKSTKIKKKHKRYKTSRKSQNPKKCKKARHNSESSVEEVWVERTIENSGYDETPFKSSSAEALQKPTYVNSSSSDSMENNFLIDSQCVQNQTSSHS